MRRQFKDTVQDLALTENSLVLLFGDVSVYLFRDFQALYPTRFYNLGICENTIISTAAGLASQGLTPVAHTIAPFLTERCYEQIKLDLCYNNFACNIVTCGASFDYAWDGATHHCFTDLGILRMLPNIEVFQPGSSKEFDALFRQRYKSSSPKYFRLSDFPHAVDIDAVYGKGVVLLERGAQTTVVTSGPILGNVLEACKGLNVNLIYFHTIKPIDHTLLAKFSNTRMLIVSDAHGLAEAVHEVPGLCTITHGVRDMFCSCYGTIENARSTRQLDIAGITTFIRSEMAS